MRRILVVDDDPDILKLVDRILAQAGHIVFTAKDSLRAMDLINSTEFDLLISDANMPHYSGFELVKTLRHDKKFDRLLITMLTARRDRKDIERAIEAGVDDYIVKPIDPLILLQKIDTLLSQQTPQQHAEVNINGMGPLTSGSLGLKVEINSISELGVLVHSTMPLTLGQVVDLEAPLFEQIGVRAPQMKVLNTETDPMSGRCEARLIFLGPQDAFLRGLRKWILAHGSLARTA